MAIRYNSLVHDFSAAFKNQQRDREHAESAFVGAMEVALLAIRAQIRRFSCQSGELANPSPSLLRKDQGTSSIR